MLVPAFTATSARNGQVKAQKTDRCESWDRRVLLAAYHAHGQFHPADLGPPSTKLVEALHRLVDIDYVVRVTLPKCRWVYEMTETGNRLAQAILGGGRYKKPRTGFRRRWVQPNARFSH